MDISKLVRRNILEMKPYSSARDEFEGSASVFLDANENPYPSFYNRYPDPHQRELKRKIALLKNVNEGQLFLGNGSDEAIGLLICAFCEPGVDEILVTQPTYGMYAVSASVNNTKIIQVPLTETFDINLEAITQAITPATKLIFLCSPNNPSGNLLSTDKIIELIKIFKGLVIIDEAYIDFTQSKSFLESLIKFNNLVVLQTLSKAWGLAGLRLGMCFACPEIISLLNKIKPPYNINSATQSIVLDRLNNIELKNSQVKEIIEQREILKKELMSLKIVNHVFPSDSNFLLVKVQNAKQVYARLLKKDIVVRGRSDILLCDDCLRISIGTPNENEILIEELSKL